MLPVFGTLVGLALVWFSSRWEHQTKVAATLLAAIPIALWVVIGPVLAVRGEGGSFGLSQALLSGGHAPFIAMAVATALLNLCPLGAAAVLAHRLNGDIASTQPDRPRAGES